MRETHHSQTSKNDLLSELKAAGAQIRGGCVSCPFHDDRNPSGNIYQSDDGVWRFKCMARECGFIGDVFDIRAKRSGVDLNDVLRESSGATRPKRETKTWPTLDAFLAEQKGNTVYRYRNPDDGHDDMLVVRIDGPVGKRFLQAHQNGSRQIRLCAPPKPWPLYNRRAVRKAETVVVVEGEKCVHALHKLKIVATTSPGGAGKAKHADWSILAGKRVVLWPDRHETGNKHMQEVAEILSRLEPTPDVSMVEPPDPIPPGGDVVDFIASLDDGGKIDADLKRDTVQTIIDAAMPAADDATLVEDRIEAMIDGRFTAVPFPHHHLARLTRALIPGVVMLLCGDPGDGKSLLMLQWFVHWHEDGQKVALLELEDDKAYHLQRVLAQMAGDSNLTDPDWVKANADDARGAKNENRQRLRSFGRRLWVQSENPTQRSVAEWVEARAKEGCRIIGVDPVTLAQVQGKQWEEDLKFLNRVRCAVVDAGASLVLVTHPKQGSKGAGLAHLAGGAAYSRFSQCAVWMKKHHPDKLFHVRQRDRHTQVHQNLGVTVNREMVVCKARNGPGTCRRVAFHLWGESLLFADNGVIIQD